MVGGFPGGTSGKNRPADAGDLRDLGLIPGWEGPSKGGHGNPLQCSCLENPHGQRSLEATVHRVTKSWTGLKQFSTHACTHVVVKRRLYILVIPLFKR